METKESDNLLACKDLRHRRNSISKKWKNHTEKKASNSIIEDEDVEPHNENKESESKGDSEVY